MSNNISISFPTDNPEVMRRLSISKITDSERVISVWILMMS